MALSLKVRKAAAGGTAAAFGVGAEKTQKPSTRISRCSYFLSVFEDERLLPWASFLPFLDDFLVMSASSIRCSYLTRLRGREEHFVSQT